MPMPNTHTARQADPEAFEEFAQKELTEGVTAVVGRRKGSETWEIQSVRFDSSKFTPKEARDWLEEHDFSTEQFEEAAEEDEAEAAYDPDDDDEAEAAYDDEDDDCECDEEEDEDCECDAEAAAGCLSLHCRADSLLAYDPDQPRDEGGRWSSGGGGGGGGGGSGRGERGGADRATRSAQKKERQAVEKKHATEKRGAELSRKKEDTATTRQRDKEDRATTRQRDKEDRDVQRQRDREDNVRQKEADRQDRELQKARDAQDRRKPPDRVTEREREKQDLGTQKQREEHEGAIQKARDEEDRARDAERDKADDHKQATRDTEDMARDAIREKEDNRREEAHGKERADLERRHAESNKPTADEHARRAAQQADRENKDRQRREADQIRKASERDRQAREIIRKADEQRGPGESKPMSKADEREAGQQRQESQRQERFSEQLKREGERAEQERRRESGNYQGPLKNPESPRDSGNYQGPLRNPEDARESGNYQDRQSSISPGGRRDDRERDRLRRRVGAGAATLLRNGTNVDTITFTLSSVTRYRDFYLKDLAAGVKAVMGITAPGASEVHEVRFDRGRFTDQSARAWLAARDYEPDDDEEEDDDEEALIDPEDCPMGEDCPMREREDAEASAARCSAGTCPMREALHGGKVGKRARALAVPSELRCSAVSGLELLAAASADNAPARVSLTAYTGVPMKLDGFAYPVVVDLETLRVNRGSTPLLRSHDPERVAGHSTRIDVTQQRLKVDGVLSGVPQYTDDIAYTAGRGFTWQVSMGAGLSQKPEFVPAGESAKVNGRVWKGPVLVARNAVLREVSLLAMGADSDTSASFEEVPELSSTGR